MLYHLQSELGVLVESKIHKDRDYKKLLTDQIRQILRENHGRNGDIRIWKEIRIELGNGAGHHYVRAFHDFDMHGTFFDWVQVKVAGQEPGVYLPGKVVLLYQTDDNRDLALIWLAKPATETERRRETNLSARWRMDLLPSGLPRIMTFPTEVIERCILVYEHWKCPNNDHLPSARLRPGFDTSTFVIDEAYDRYAWALNFLDKDRWTPMDSNS